GPHLAKDGVAPVQMRRGSERDEELRPIRVGAGIRHREDAGTVVAPLGTQLVGEVVAGSTTAGPGGIAALGHEPANDPVKRGAVVEAGPREVDEVLDGHWSIGCEQLADDLTALRLEPSRVALGLVEVAGRRGRFVSHANLSLRSGTDRC